ncbi:hypothetical protein SI65_03664 [Aspergillus cristatus]|uniref:Nuclear speckle splicing regulatory protein 1 N-terminal domain-containing protein n=1 Tax=Aspergillus cristatus TaxID=573508 RepID=A0A1E3BII4_ASPCR|nr:hypothetical protein SI65_03664 [Aspergillus cristatus]
MPPNLSYGLNLPNKNNKKPGPLGQKRKKTIFDDDSDDDQKPDGGEVEISTIGGINDEPAPSKPQLTKKEPSEPPSKRKPFFTTTAATSGKKTGPKPLSKNSIFADGDGEDGTEERQEANTTGGGLSVPKSQQQKTADPSKNYTNLSALHSSKKHAQEAQELDPSIYSYDSVYDSLHAKPEQDKKAAEKSSEVPKYMTSLLRSAEIRKRDQLRARDRMLAREREAEGDEFADKEKFVTAAYKAQQEEMRRVEAEEAEREKQEEERRKKSGNVGMVGFYRDILSRDEQRHEQVLKATEEAAQRIKTGEPETEEAAEAKADEDEEKASTRRAAELNAKGAHIAVNDEGQVVDKRQLLSAGLNVAPKPKAAPSAAAAPASRGPGVPGKRFDGAHSARNDQRARTTEMIAAQLEERAKQEAEAEEARQKEVAERNKSRKSEKDVSSAKERYLARKREREAQGGK